MKKAIQMQTLIASLLIIFSSFIIIAAYADIPNSVVYDRYEMQGNTDGRIFDSSWYSVNGFPSWDDVVAVGDGDKVMRPPVENFYTEYQTRYINAPKGNHVYVYRNPGSTKNPDMIDHGAKVYVIAVEGNASLIIYRTVENVAKSGWVNSNVLSDTYPGYVVSVGEASNDFLENIGDPSSTWSRDYMSETKSKFLVLDEPVDQCVGFTLEYRAQYGGYEDCSGTRNIYINDGMTGWRYVGNFSYETAKSYHVVVNLKTPTTLCAVAAPLEIERDKPFSVRENVLDVLVKKEDDNINSSSVICTFNNGMMRITGEGKLKSEDITAAVSDRTLIEQVEIADGVTEIGTETFQGCSSLTDVSIPDSVISIGDAAFLGCEALREISIPDSVSTIGSCAFANCVSLTEIDLPAALTKIESMTFKHCWNLISIDLPFGVTSIGEQVFWQCRKLENIVIPNSVKSIGNYTLGEGTNLRSVFIPSSVTYIGESCFVGLWTGSPLSDIYYGGSESQWKNLNTYISEDITVHYNAEKAEEIIVSCIAEGDTLTITGNGIVKATDTAAVVEDKTNIRHVIINDGIRMIGQGAFAGYENLLSVSIPESVTKIGFMSFSGCKSLNCIALPNSVTDIGNSAFDGCESIKTLNLPKDLRSIGRFAFSSCPALRSVFVPESVTGIDAKSFDFDYGVLSDVYYGGTESQWLSFNLNCPSDVSIHYNSDEAEEISVEYVINGSTLTISGNGKVLKKDLEKMIPNKHKIKSVEIKSGITAIGRNAFRYEYDNLTEIKIPESVKSINEFAIDCGNIKHITLPEGVTTLEKYAISGSSLESIFIPESVTNIDENGISICFALKDIYYAGNEDQWLALKASGMIVPQKAKVHCNSTW